MLDEQDRIVQLRMAKCEACSDSAGGHCRAIDGRYGGRAMIHKHWEAIHQESASGCPRGEFINLAKECGE